MTDSDVSDQVEADDGIGDAQSEQDALEANAQHRAVESIEEAAFRRTENTLTGRFTLLPEHDIPDLDTKTAKACVVKDHRTDADDCYALICDQGLPSRIQAAIDAKKAEHKHMLPVLAHGAVNISTLNECRYVYIFPRPKGVKLVDLIAPKSAISEKFIIKEIILPFTQIIHALSEQDVCHGKIHPDNVFYDEGAKHKVTLGECFSEPAGYAQSFYYEPIERMIAHPLGKGESDEKVDYFALGILVMHTLLGFNPMQHLSREEYIEKCLTNGMYNTIVGNREFSGMTEDLLKGLLADDPDERWGYAHLVKWLGGKKYNLLRPTPPREAPRPYTFLDKPYFNRKHLCHQFHQHWGKAKSELRDKKVQRWVELSVQEPDIAKTLTRIVELTGGETGRLPTDDDDLVTKSITLLDPTGPFRLHTLSTHLSGIGPVLASAFRDNNKALQHLVLRIIESDVIGTWSELNKTLPGFHNADIVWRIEKRRHTFQLTTLGYGLERILYDFNLSMPCMSPIVSRHYVTTMKELMYSLDSQPADVMKNQDPVDRHIAAFICSRLNVFKEIKSDLDIFPHYKGKMILKYLVLLAATHRKIGEPPLPNLCGWIAERCKPLIDQLNSRSLQKDVRIELDKLAAKGNITDIMKLIINKDVISKDQEGLLQATGRYLKNAKKIKELNIRGTQEERARNIGYKLAQTISFGILTIAILSLVRDYVRL